MDLVTQIIIDIQPDVLTLTEAQLHQDTPVQAVAIPGYNLYTDSLYRQGLTARTVTYVSQKVPVKQRLELDSPDLFIVLKTLTKGKSKINELSFYRQQRTNVPGTEERRVARSPHSQIDRFERIADMWVAIMDKGLETISMSYTNLSRDLLIHGNTRSHHEKDLEPTAKHYCDKILIRGAIIVNNKITHVSALCSNGCIINPITTTNLARMMPATTPTHQSSDHKVFSTVLLSAAPIDGPKYAIVRDY